MEKADLSKTKPALPGEASRPDRLRAVSLKALELILSAHRIYLERAGSKGRAPISVLPTLRGAIFPARRCGG